MKTKLTLSVDRKAVRNAKNLSQRLGKSVSEIFEESMIRADATKRHQKTWKELLGGTLTLTDADAVGNDRAARLTSRSKTKATRRNAKRA